MLTAKLVYPFFAVLDDSWYKSVLIELQYIELIETQYLQGSLAISHANVLFEVFDLLGPI